jgi:hypothetical protein
MLTKRPTGVVTGLCAAAFAVAATSAASAVDVTFDGVTYDVSTFLGFSTANSGSFDAASMPWWNDRALAKINRDAYLEAISWTGDLVSRTHLTAAYFRRCRTHIHKDIPSNVGQCRLRYVLQRRRSARLDPPRSYRPFFDQVGSLPGPLSA